MGQLWNSFKGVVTNIRGARQPLDQRKQQKTDDVDIGFNAQERAIQSRLSKDNAKMKMGASLANGALRISSLGETISRVQHSAESEQAQQEEMRQRNIAALITKKSGDDLKRNSLILQGNNDPGKINIDAVSFENQTKGLKKSIGQAGLNPFRQAILEETLSSNATTFSLKSGNKLNQINTNAQIEEKIDAAPAIMTSLHNKIAHAIATGDKKQEELLLKEADGYVEDFNTLSNTTNSQREKIRSLNAHDNYRSIINNYSDISNNDRRLSEQEDDSDLVHNASSVAGSKSANNSIDQQLSSKPESYLATVASNPAIGAMTPAQFRNNMYKHNEVEDTRHSLAHGDVPSTLTMLKGGSSTQAKIGAKYTKMLADGNGEQMALEVSPRDGTLWKAKRDVDRAIKNKDPNLFNIKNNSRDVLDQWMRSHHINNDQYSHFGEDNKQIMRQASIDYFKRDREGAIIGINASADDASYYKALIKGKNSTVQGGSAKAAGANMTHLLPPSTSSTDVMTYAVAADPVTQKNIEKIAQTNKIYGESLNGEKNEGAQVRIGPWYWGYSDTIKSPRDLPRFISDNEDQFNLLTVMSKGGMTKEQASKYMSTVILANSIHGETDLQGGIDHTMEQIKEMQEKDPAVSGVSSNGTKYHINQSSMQNENGTYIPESNVGDYMDAFIDLNKEKDLATLESKAKAVYVDPNEKDPLKIKAAKEAQDDLYKKIIDDKYIGAIGMTFGDSTVVQFRDKSGTDTRGHTVPITKAENDLVIQRMEEKTKERLKEQDKIDHNVLLLLARP